LPACGAAFQKVEEKIEWHRTQIGNSQNQTSEDARAADRRPSEPLVRNKFSNLAGVQQSQPKRSAGASERKRRRKRKAAKVSKGRRPERATATALTGDLIAACLKKARKPVDTKHITATT
jgi:hypothetical protein